MGSPAHGAFQVQLRESRTSGRGYNGAVSHSSGAWQWKRLLRGCCETALLSLADCNSATFSIQLYPHLLVSENHKARGEKRQKGKTELTTREAQGCCSQTLDVTGWGGEGTLGSVSHLHISLLSTVAQQTSFNICINQSMANFLYDKWSTPWCSPLVENECLVYPVLWSLSPLIASRVSIWIKTKLEKFATPVFRPNGQGESKTVDSSLWNSVPPWGKVSYQGFLLAHLGHI